MHTTRQRAIQEILNRYNSEMKLSIAESLVFSAMVFGCSQYTPLSFEHKLATAFCAGNLYGLYNEVSIAQDTLADLKKYVPTNNFALHQRISALKRDSNTLLHASTITSLMLGASWTTGLCVHGTIDVSQAITSGLMATSGLLLALRCAHDIDSTHKLSDLSKKIIQQQ